MAPKKGLGKGLGSLIPEGKNIAPATKTKVVEKVIEKPTETKLRITEVEPNRDQPRHNFNEDALTELSDSIKLHGIISPIIVIKRDDYYEIVAGERRWRAAKMAGLKEVPVIIKDYSDREAMEVALIENLQREDLNPIEEALAYQRLIKEHELKQDELAERVSKSRTAITNSMRLLKLDDKVQNLLIEDLITSGHARAILGLTDKSRQLEVAEKVIDEKLNVRDVEKLVKKINNPATKAPKAVDKNDIIYRKEEEKLKNAIGTKVIIKNKSNNSGKIEIDYYSMDDFEKIIERLKRQE